MTSHTYRQEVKKSTQGYTLFIVILCLLSTLVQHSAYYGVTRRVEDDITYYTRIKQNDSLTDTHYHYFYQQEDAHLNELEDAIKQDILDEGYVSNTTVSAYTTILLEDEMTVSDSVNYSILLILFGLFIHITYTMWDDYMRKGSKKLKNKTVPISI